MTEGNKSIQSPIILKKTASRLMVILQLYQLKLFGGEVNNLAPMVEDYLKMLSTPIGKQISEELGLAKAEYAKQFITKLARCYHDHNNKVDELLNSEIANYDNEKLNPTCRALLEIAISEMISELTPYKVIIDEYTSLADALLGVQEVGFVNSVLDKVRAKLQPIA